MRETPLERPRTVTNFLDATIAFRSEQYIGESSNGRTADSDSAYLGSSPSSPASGASWKRCWPLKPVERVRIPPPLHWGDSR